MMVFLLQVHLYHLGLRTMTERRQPLTRPRVVEGTTVLRPRGILVGTDLLPARLRQ